MRQSKPETFVVSGRVVHKTRAALKRIAKRSGITLCALINQILERAVN